SRNGNNRPACPAPQSLPVRPPRRSVFKEQLLLAPQVAILGFDDDLHQPATGIRQQQVGAIKSGACLLHLQGLVVAAVGDTPETQLYAGAADRGTVLIQQLQFDGS